MARLTLTARADGGEPHGRTVALTSIATGDNIVLTATADAGPLAQLMPAQYDRFQRLRWLLEVDETAPAHVHGVSWSSSLERPIQVAACQVPGDPSRRLGAILPGGAPVTGLSDVTLSLVFRQDNGAEFTEPLITDGLVVESPHSHKRSGITDDLAIHDAGARVVHTKASRQYAAGSGLARETVVGQLAGDAGISAGERSIPNMSGTLRKAVDLDNGDPLDLAQAIAEVPGWRLLFGRQGEYTAKRLAPESEARDIRWVFGPADWIHSANGQEYGYDLRAAPDAYTFVSTKGSRQIERADSGCADETAPPTVARTFVEPFTPSYLAYVQLASGPGSPSYSATGFIPSVRVDPQLVSETKTWVTMRCGVLKAQKSKTFALRNIQKSRLTRDDDAAGTPLSYSSAYVSDNSLDRPGYVYVTDTWMVDTESEESRLYLPHLSANAYLYRRVSWRKGWYNPRTAIKERASVTDDWETATAASAYRDLGNGTGVQFERERFIVTERETEQFGVQDGLVMQRTLTREAYGRVPGSLYLYADGEFGERDESFRVVYQERESWTRFREGMYFRRVERFGIDGLRDSQLPATEELVRGGPPAAEMGDFTGNADRFEHREIEGEADGSALEAVRPEHRFGPAVFEYAETEEELEALASRLLLMSNGALLTFWIPPNPRVEIGDWVRFIGPLGSGLYEKVKVVETSIQGGDGAPIVQQIVGEIYPEIN